MPQFEIPLSEYSDSITRPIVAAAAYAVMERTGMSKDTRIFYPGYLEQAQQVGSAITGETDAQVNFSHDNRLSIDADEVPEEETIIARTGFKPDAPFIFLDPALELSIRPIFQRQRVEISFTYRARDQAEAERWRNRQRILTAQGRGPVLFHPQFHYPIANPVVELLRTMHHLRENKAPYSEDFDTYFKKYRSEAMTQLVDLAGKNATHAMPVTLHDIDGRFDWTGMPEKGQREGQGTAWSISFRYVFYYDKPIGLWLTWPLVVHNQLIPEKYRYSPEDKPLLGPGDRKGTGYNSTLALQSHSGDRKNYDPRYYRGWQLPDWDEFITSDIQANTLRCFTTLVFIDESDPTMVLDLTDVRLPDGTLFAYTPAILGFLKHTEYKNIAKPRKSVFNLAVYEGAYRVSPNEIEVDQNLVVRLKRPMDLRKVYHLRLGLHYAWGELDKEAQENLKDDGLATDDIITAIKPDIRPIITIGPDIIPDPEFDRIIDGLEGSKKGLDNHGMWNVQYFTIRVKNGTVD